MRSLVHDASRLAAMVGRPGGNDRDGGIGLVVLGCRASRGRSDVAARTYLADATRFSCVLASGGRAWAGENDENRTVEADALARAMIDLGVPTELVVRERCSHSTRENAQYSAKILARRGIKKITLVTSDWHVPRARRHFENEGLDVEAAPVVIGSRSLWSRVLTRAHEHAAALLDRIVR
jgi:uncharacterized SAM-binding protein YcdF (DUF218 family)